MGFLRKGLFVATGGLSGVAGVRANSKKDRTAKAMEAQLRLQKQAMRGPGPIWIRTPPPAVLEVSNQDDDPEEIEVADPGNIQWRWTGSDWEFQGADSLWYPGEGPDDMIIPAPPPTPAAQLLLFSDQPPPEPLGG